MDGAPKSPLDACIRSLIAHGAMTEEDSQRAISAARGDESAPAAAVRLGLIPSSLFAAEAAAAADMKVILGEDLAALGPPPPAGAPQASFPFALCTGR